MRKNQCSLKYLFSLKCGKHYKARLLLYLLNETTIFRHSIGAAFIQGRRLFSPTFVFQTTSAKNNLMRPRIFSSTIRSHRVYKYIWQPSTKEQHHRLPPPRHCLCSIDAIHYTHIAHAQSAATVRGRLLLCSSQATCSVYMRATSIQGVPYI